MSTGEHCHALDIVSTSIADSLDTKILYGYNRIARILLLYSLWIGKSDKNRWSEGFGKPSCVFSLMKRQGAESEGRVKCS